MSTSDSTVAIIGAGYAGVMAANRLRSSLTPEEASRVRVVMINRTGEFVERIRLHQLAAGTIPSAARPLSDMLHHDIELVVGDVVGMTLTGSWSISPPGPGRTSKATTR